MERSTIKMKKQLSNHKSKSKTQLCQWGPFDESFQVFAINMANDPRDAVVHSSEWALQEQVETLLCTTSSNASIPMA